MANGSRACAFARNHPPPPSAYPSPYRMPHGDATKAPTPLRKPGAPTPAKGAAKPITRKRRIGRMILVTLGLLTATVFVVNWTGLAKAFIVGLTWNSGAVILYGLRGQNCFH